MVSLIFAELQLKMLYRKFDLIAIYFDVLDREGLLELTKLACLFCYLGLHCFMDDMILDLRFLKLSLEE